MLSAEEFLDKADRERVAAVIKDAEARTSGEIRIHLEDHIEEDVLVHAAYVFEQLGMQRTRERNGVLIYVCVADRLVAVIGDKGINERVPAGFWNELVETLKQCFAEGQRAEGLCQVVSAAATMLSEYFPPRKDDRNELSNEVSIGSR